MPLDDYARWVRQPDLPPQPVSPRLSCFVCGTPRSGTWLLCGLLASTGLAGRPHEWFWRDTEWTNRRAWGVRDFAEYVARVRDAATTENGVFASKLMWGHVGELVGRLRDLGDDGSGRSVLEGHFPGPRFVCVRRADPVAQAVSWSKAIRTGRWHHWDPAPIGPAPAYDRDEIEALAREAVAADAGWRAWFAATEFEPLVVPFEDLVADSIGATRTVLEFLDLPADVPVAEQTVRSADDVNADWLARYRPSS